MGLEKSDADAAIASLAAIEDELPPTIRPAEYDIAQGEAIPPPPDSAPARPRVVKLNRAAIASIMNDTRDVAEMLAAAMQAEALQSERPAGDVATAGTSLQHDTQVGVQPVVVAANIVAAAASPTATETMDPTLPSRYASFYQLLMARAEWTIEDAEATARQHGHMLSGVIETLNDWSFERYGGPLFVEDAGRLLIERERLN
jgi:hypothetical protein